MNDVLLKPEVLSPCGSPEAVSAALAAGADAVYLGLKNFSARHNAANFSEDELFDAVRECHRSGVLVYLALNTLIFDDELHSVADALALACRARIDGIIVQDMAVYEMIKSACPQIPIHASTQMTLHTAYGAIRAKQLGFSRVVAARELPLKVLSEMAAVGIEVEAFSHGALCMCVSGQCYLSVSLGGRSANRGLCAGACRLPFSAKGKPGDEYALSLKDLSYCAHVKELADAGVCSLKIEGRMKRPEYVAAATDALRKAVDGIDYDENILRAVFSRGEFTDSYLLDGPNPSMFGSRQKEDVLAAGEVLPELRKIYKNPRQRFELSMSFRALTDTPVSLWVSDGRFEAVVTDEPLARALSHETDKETVAAQLSKLGGTVYTLKNLDITLSPGLMIPKSRLNDLRRRAVSELDEKRIAGYPERPFSDGTLTFDFPMPLILKHPCLRIRVESVKQLLRINLEPKTKIVIPLSEDRTYISSGRDPSLAVLSLPRFDIDEKNTAEELKFAKKLGYTMVECSNLGQAALVRSLGMEPQGGFGLNITNSLAARHYFFKEGIKKMLLSPELKPVRAQCIATPAETGIIVYGRLPLMITRNCPIMASVGCKNCQKKLTDRKGAEFPVICRKNIGVYELLNSRPLWLADKYKSFSLDFADIMFTVETPEECARIYSAYRDSEPPSGVFTRGIKIVKDAEHDT